MKYTKAFLSKIQFILNAHFIHYNIINIYLNKKIKSKNRKIHTQIVPYLAASISQSTIKEKQKILTFYEVNHIRMCRLHHVDSIHL